MANLTATDEDELLEIEEVKASDGTPSIFSSNYMCLTRQILGPFAINAFHLSWDSFKVPISPKFLFFHLILYSMQ